MTKVHDQTSVADAVEAARVGATRALLILRDVDVRIASAKAAIAWASVVHTGPDGMRALRRSLETAERKRSSATRSAETAARLAEEAFGLLFARPEDAARRAWVADWHTRSAITSAGRAAAACTVISATERALRAARYASGTAHDSDALRAAGRALVAAAVAMETAGRAGSWADVGDAPSDARTWDTVSSADAYIRTADGALRDARDAARRAGR